MNPGVVPSNPFVAGGRLDNPQLFVGRQDELHAIASRMSGAQPTSVNVVGEKRIGKSSLLYHFFQTWEQRVQDPSRYVVIYLSLQGVQCQREEDFYLAVAQELLSRPAVRAIPSLMTALQLNPLNRLAFSAAIALFKNQNQNQKLLPVLCLDDFKTLFQNKSEFDDGFYNNLRSLMDSSSLMLVIASQKELDFYARRHQLTSSFFNLGHVLKLRELSEEDVTQLVLLPSSTIPHAQSALGMHEQKLTRQLGGRHPFLLQLAGMLACEARQQGKDDDWVKTRFKQESRRLPRPGLGSRSWWRSLRWLVWNLPIRIGSVVKSIGVSIDNISAWIIGVVVVFAFILVVFGFVTHSDAWQLIQKLVNKVLGG
ncbi:MAG: AAA-like domain-containing protein [Iphinoe sp. HA4291-MV1]|nr:AAA-like domain-containing protein [Iphinoe sp. HA4291-MV1]